MVEFGRVPGKDRIRASIKKTILTSTGKESNQWEYRKILESERLRGKDRIRASIEKLSRRLEKNGRINVSTEI